MIGTLNERSLHAQLKQRLSQADDQFEVPLDGYVIDIVRPDTPDYHLIEIQTGNFGSLRKKMDALVPNYLLQLVYPVPAQKWILKNGRRRKSPKRGTIYTLFSQLVYLPALLAEPNFSLRVLLVDVEETKVFDPSRRGRRRKGWVSAETVLLDITASHIFWEPADLLSLIPHPLPQPFSTADLARAIGQPRAVAQKMAYCLRHLQLVDIVGKDGNAMLYRFPQ